MARKFEELRRKMSPERRVRNEAAARKMLVEMTLDELRKLKEITQVELATALEMNQGALSRIEHQSDMHISTLKSIVEALGGSLTLRVDFLNGDSYAVALGAQREQPELAAAKR
jgi:transcriptional regulator with XRE-family HTH domain